jgi:hypothetical protein
MLALSHVLWFDLRPYIHMRWFDLLPYIHVR